MPPEPRAIIAGFSSLLFSSLLFSSLLFSSLLFSSLLRVLRGSVRKNPESQSITLSTDRGQAVYAFSTYSATMRCVEKKSGIVDALVSARAIHFFGRPSRPRS